VNCLKPILPFLSYPGRINTNISKNALVGDGKQYGATDENNEVGMDVRLCAEKS
jgi:hypothetical protein